MQAIQSQSHPVFNEPPLKPHSYEVGEPIELKGMGLSNGDYHWISGYFVVVQRWESGQWWYAVARPLVKATINPVSETTDPIYYPESALRKARIQERHPQIISHYKGKSYWQQLGHYYRRIDLPYISN
jgi:hypothetical protein